MKYELYLNIKDKKEKIFDILFLGFTLINVIFLFCKLTFLFEVTLVLNLVCYFIVKFVVLNKTNKTIMKAPVLFDDENNMYLVDNNPSLIVFIVSVILLEMLGAYLIVMILKIEVDYFLSFILFFLIYFHVSNIIREIKDNKLKNEFNNIQSLINNKKIRLLKIKSIKQSSNDIYCVTYENNNQREVIFSKNYENYWELINKINLRCN